MHSRHFKTCSRCRHAWPERDDFVADPQVELIGYQFNATDLESGLFLFNHTAPTCRTTLGIAAKVFSDLHQGPIFESRLFGGPECPAYCLRKDILDACPKACECRFVRDILQVVRNWPKRPARAPVPDGKEGSL